MQHFAAMKDVTPLLHGAPCRGTAVALPIVFLAQGRERQGSGLAFCCNERRDPFSERSAGFLGGSRRSFCPSSHTFRHCPRRAHHVTHDRACSVGGNPARATPGAGPGRAAQPRTLRQARGLRSARSTRDAAGPAPAEPRGPHVPRLDEGRTRATLHQPGPQPDLRLQSRRGRAGLRRGGAAGPGVRDGVLGAGPRARPEHQRADGCRRRTQGQGAGAAGARTQGHGHATREAPTSTPSRRATPARPTTARRPTAPTPTR